MFEEKEGTTWRWFGLVVVVCLLVVCVLLLDGQLVKAAMPDLVTEPQSVAMPEEVTVAAEPAREGERSTGALPGELAQLIGQEADPQAVQADVDVAASTWWMGNYARPGGVAVYGVWYSNLEGSALSAEGVILTSTLPAGTSYAGDTSGLPVDVGANGLVTWTIGTLDPAEMDLFMLTINVPGDQPTGEGALGDRCVRIQTTTAGDPDPDNDGNCAGPANVGLDDVELEVNKGPEPGDPTPGQEFDYVIGWCNHRGAASGPVTLTDTLPEGVSLVDWQPWPQWQRWWNEVYAGDDQLVLEAPGLPGDWCAEIAVRLALDVDVPLGTVLENRVELVVDGDVDPDNNWQINQDAQVSPPRPDVGVDKWAEGGVLVPGGWVGFGIGFGNYGNIAAGASMTDTLPPGFTYTPGSALLDETPFSDPLIIGDQLIWELGPLDVNEGHNLQFEAGIDSGTSPDLYENCVQIGLDTEDSWPGNNGACAPVEVFPSGPNLHVEKYARWEGEAIAYEIFVANYGDQILFNVHLTDTYPVGTTSMPQVHEPELPDHVVITATSNYTDNQWLFEIKEFGPGEGAWINFPASVDDPDLRPAEYGNLVEAELFPGEVNPDDNQDWAWIFRPEVEEVDVWLEPDDTGHVWGQAPPGAHVTVTTPVDEFYATAGDGDCPSCWDVGGVGILPPGSQITVTALGGAWPVVIDIPDPFTAEVDRGVGTVSGQIDHLDSHPVEVRGWWEGGWQQVTTDGAGNYEAVYDWIPPGADGVTYFETTVNHAQVGFYRYFRSMDLILEVNYGHDWVQGNYEPDHIVWITVTDSFDEVKGTAELLSQEVPEWGDFVGFSTNLDDPWAGEPPDILPGDWVYGRVDNGYTSEVQAGEISGDLDITAETIAGTVTAPWPAGTILDAWCSVWVEEGPSQNFPVDAGGGEYSCDFSGQWDLQPGQDVAVGYYEPDLDQVINVFYEPAPDLSVNKWVPGPGEVMYDGLSVWRIQVQNDGEAAAETVTLTDTMPAGTIYYANSSGLEPAEVDSQLIWDFGPMEPGEGLEFILVLQNETAPDQTLVNQADVWAEWDRNPDNNHAEAEVWATDTEPPELGVDKGPEPGDPAPGQTFLYSINVGNNGPAATGPVTVIDSIPDGTSIVDWWTQGDWPWQEVSRNGQLVLETVALPGYEGDTIYLQLLVDGTVALGTQLTNTVEVVSPDSSALAMNNDAWVGEPRWEGFVNKHLAWGTLVPGGVVAYNVHVRNQGNMAADFTLIDTLPAGTSFEGAWWSDGRDGGEIVPTFPEPGVAVFDLGELKPAEFRDVEVRLLLDPDLLPGDELENCAEINVLGPGDWPGDNEDCVVETVRPEGPNVRVQKDYQWNSEDQLQFYLTFWNLGTTDLYDVEIIDTLPAGTYWVDEWWPDFWEDVGVQVDGGQVTFTLSRLEPGWGAGIGFNVNLDPPGVEGEAYTNTVSMPLVGDTFPGDNYDEATAYTGPDLYVDKSLAEGEPRPGALLTYTIEFGNQNVWPWNSDWLGDEEPSSMIVDLLPEGMTFITATAPWNPEEGWMPDIDGQELSWGFGPINAGEYWEFQLVAQVSPSAESGDLLTNTVEILSLSPGDVDPLPDDNSDQVVLEVLAPALAIEKEVSTSAVAGTIADYTLSVENLGNVPATSVSFADTLPDDLTYVDSDGTWDGTDITWSAGELAPFGGTAGGWFSANLTCEAGVRVANETYSVTSNEGATATGATVAVTTIAPTIQLSLASAPDPGIVDETVTLTVTAITDGTDLTFEWDFGDGPVSGGGVETYVWDTTGSYTVVVTATDECGFSEAVSTTVTVEESAFYIYLPVVVR